MALWFYLSCPFCCVGYHMSTLKCQGQSTSNRLGKSAVAYSYTIKKRTRATFPHILPITLNRPKFLYKQRKWKKYIQNANRIVCGKRVIKQPYNSERGWIGEKNTCFMQFIVCLKGSMHKSNLEPSNQWCKRRPGAGRT